MMAGFGKCGLEGELSMFSSTGKQTRAREEQFWLQDGLDKVREAPERKNEETSLKRMTINQDPSLGMKLELLHVLHEARKQTQKNQERKGAKFWYLKVTQPSQHSARWGMRSPNAGSQDGRTLGAGKSRDCFCLLAETGLL